MERKKTGERKIYRKVKMHLKSRGRKASAQFVSKVHYPPPRIAEREGYRSFWQNKETTFKLTSEKSKST